MYRSIWVPFDILHYSICHKSDRNFLKKYTFSADNCPVNNKRAVPNKAIVRQKYGTGGKIRE